MHIPLNQIIITENVLLVNKFDYVDPIYSHRVHSFIQRIPNLLNEPLGNSIKQNHCFLHEKTQLTIQTMTLF